MQRPLDTTHTVTCVSPLALGVAVSSFFSLTPSPSPSPSPNLDQVSVGPGITLRCVGHAPTRRSVLPPLGAMDACALPMCGAYGRCVRWRLVVAALAFSSRSLFHFCSIPCLFYSMSILSHVYSIRARSWAASGTVLQTRVARTERAAAAERGKGRTGSAH